MKKLALLLTVATFAITSCNENKPAEETTETAPVEAAPVEAAPVADSAMAAPADTATAAH